MENQPTTPAGSDLFYHPHVAEIVAGLHALASDIEAGFIPAPYGVYLTASYSHVLDEDAEYRLESLTQDDVRRSMDLAPGGWSKEYDDFYAKYEKRYNQHVALTLCLDRETVCTRREVGQKWVPATEGKYVPVYEWDCAPTDDDMSGYETFHDEGVDLRAQRKHVDNDDDDTDYVAEAELNVTDVQHAERGE